MEAAPLNCRNCGARLPPVPVGTRYINCGFCHQGFDLGPAPPPPVTAFGGGPLPPPPGAYGPPQVYVATPPSGGRMMLYYLFPLFFVLIGAGVGIYNSMRATSRAQELSAEAQRQHDQQLASANAATGAGTTATPGKKTNLRWGGGRSDYPVLAWVSSGDDPVGFYQEENEIKLGGFDKSSLRRVWSASGFGNGWDQGQHAYVAAAGGKIAASDYRGRVRVFDARSGAEEGQVTVTDRVEALVPAPGDKPQVWAKVKDGKDVLVDLSPAKATPAKRPAWAVEPYFADTHCNFHSPNSKCVERSARAPAGNGFVVDRVLSEADLRVGVIRKYPGTEIAYLVGFKDGAKAPAWKQQIVEGDPVIASAGTTIPVELASGRVFSVYEMTNNAGKHMTAFDAKTGDRLWNVHLPFSPAGHYSVKATETRVFFPYGATLYVFDSRTGKLVGQIGN